MSSAESRQTTSALRTNRDAKRDRDPITQSAAATTNGRPLTRRLRSRIAHEDSAQDTPSVVAAADADLEGKLDRAAPAARRAKKPPAGAPQGADAKIARPDVVGAMAPRRGHHAPRHPPPVDDGRWKDPAKRAGHASAMPPFDAGTATKSDRRLRSAAPRGPAGAAAFLNPAAGGVPSSSSSSAASASAGGLSFAPAKALPHEDLDMSRDSVASELADLVSSADEQPDASNSSWQSQDTNDLLEKLIAKGPKAHVKILTIAQLLKSGQTQGIPSEMVLAVVNAATHITSQNDQQRKDGQQDGAAGAAQRPSRSTRSGRPAKRKERPASNPNASTLSTHAGTAKRKRDKINVPTHNLLGVHHVVSETVHELGEGVLITMRRREQHNRADVAYLENQHNLSRTMRATLFDWMFEVGQEFVLNRETLHTALTYVDRYLSREQNVPRRQLQLVGVTALWLAAKSKEVYPPRAKEFAFTTDRAYEVPDMVRMELDMLTKLDWVLDPITPYAWVDWYLHELFPIPDAQGHKDNGKRASSRRAFSTRASAAAASSSVSSSSTAASVTSGLNTRGRNGLEPDCAGAEAPVSQRPDGAMLAASHQARDARIRSWMASTAAPMLVVARIMEVLDTALLDVNSLHFLPSALAATAVSHVLHEMDIAELAQIERVTRYSEGELILCRDWMSFAFELAPNELENHPKIRHIRVFYEERDLHCIQRHNKKSLEVYRTHAPQNDIMSQVSAPVSSAQWPRHASMATSPSNNPLDEVENSLDNADVLASFMRDRTNMSFVPPTPIQGQFSPAAPTTAPLPPRVPQGVGARASAASRRGRRAAPLPAPLHTGMEVIEASFNSVASADSLTLSASTTASSSTLLEVNATSETHATLLSAVEEVTNEHEEESFASGSLSGESSYVLASAGAATASSAGASSRARTRGSAAPGSAKACPGANDDDDDEEDNDVEGDLIIDLESNETL